MLNNLNNDDIKQYFLDGTYKIVPNFGNFKTLVTLIGFNKKANAFAHCCYTLLTDETQNIFENFLQLLKFNYKFKPKFINIDFSKVEENAILEVYKNDKIKILFCLFHFVQCLWRKINSLGLRKKEFIKKSKCLIFNIKLLAFIKIEEKIHIIALKILIFSMIINIHYFLIISKKIGLIKILINGIF